MAGGGWQGLVIGRPVEGWEGAGRMEVAQKNGRGWRAREGPSLEEG